LNREEFAEHGLEDIVQLEHRNVCKDGFGTGPSKIDAGQWDETRDRHAHNEMLISVNGFWKQSSLIYRLLGKLFPIPWSIWGWVSHSVSLIWFYRDPDFDDRDETSW
jgi:hypothetical protein